MKDFNDFRQIVRDALQSDAWDNYIADVPEDDPHHAATVANRRILFILGLYHDWMNGED